VDWGSGRGDKITYISEEDEKEKGYVVGGNEALQVFLAVFCLLLLY